MTLSERNTFFKIGIIFSLICILLVLAASFSIVPFYSEMEHEANTVSFILEHDYIAVHSSIAMSVLFSLVGLLLIHSFFERTSAPEILYIAIFTISFSFEALRLILPLHFMHNFPSVYLRFAARILLFARFFCIFSLFAASICAAGLDVQKNRNVIFVITIATLIITLGVPIDVLNWNASMNMVNGFYSMFRWIELAVFITTMISFLIAAKIRGTVEYNYVAIGILFAMTGRSILLNTDNWIGPVPGIVLLSFGTWLLCSKLHKIHLWL